MTITTILAVLTMGAVLGALGGGGSILAVPILVYMMGIDEKAAIATSLLVVGATSAVNAIGYGRRGLVEWKIGILFAVFAMVGAWSGGQLSQFFSGNTLLLLFAGFMMVTATMMFRKKPTPDIVEGGKEPSEKKEPPIYLIALQGVAVGTLTGLLGAGGGFVIVPTLAMLGGLDMKKAIGTSLLVIALNSFVGFSSLATHVDINYSLALTFVGLAVVGSLLGQAIGAKLDPSKLRVIFAGFVLIMSIFVLSKQLSAIPIYISVGAGILVIIFTSIKLRALPAVEKENGTEIEGSISHSV